MAEIIWTEPALDQLDDIAAYIALDNGAAASALVLRVFATVDRLAQFPESGREPPELPGFVYREVLCSPCRNCRAESGSVSAATSIRSV